jgi:hypothetical protein
MSASYLGDALGDALRAVTAVAEGTPSARASWDEERGKFRWLLERHGDEVRVQILWFDDLWTGARDAAGDVRFDATCSLRGLADAVMSAARRVLERHGEDGAPAKWVERPFPTEELRALEARAAVRGPPASASPTA